MARGSLHRLTLHGDLRKIVPRAVGYDIDGLDPGVHVGLPGPRLTLIVALGEPLAVAHAPGAVPQHHWALLAGLTETPAHVLHGTSQAGVQLALDPPSAAALIGLPVGDLVGRIVDLAEIWPETPRLLERLHAADPGRGQGAVLQEELTARTPTGPSPSAALAIAWRLIERHGGAMPIEEVAAEVGWTRRHLTDRFRHSFGLGPKQAARLVRFDRAHREVAAGRVDLAAVAVGVGYADQAHMTREFARLAGSPPGRWLRDDTMARAL